MLARAERLHWEFFRPGPSGRMPSWQRPVDVLLRASWRSWSWWLCRLSIRSASKQRSTGLTSSLQEVARTIAIIDAVTASPFAELSTNPLPTLIAYYALIGHRATWFALMASLMNLALRRGSCRLSISTRFRGRLRPLRRAGPAADRRCRPLGSSFRSLLSCCSGGVLQAIKSHGVG